MVDVIAIFALLAGLAAGGTLSYITARLVVRAFRNTTRPE